ILFEAKQPRFGISRLRTGGRGPDLDKSKAEAKHRIRNASVFVVACSQPNRIGEVETPKALCQDRRTGLRSAERGEKPAQTEFERAQAQFMRGLWRQPAQSGADQPITACNFVEGFPHPAPRDRRSCRPSFKASPCLEASPQAESRKGE